LKGRKWSFEGLHEIFLHLDAPLSGHQAYGGWTYLILLLIIFCETGLVVTPILPGDSLLFAIGSFAALGALKLEYLLVGLSIAAIAGDSVNYAIGHYMGPKVFSKKDSRIFRKEYLDKTHSFMKIRGKDHYFCPVRADSADIRSFVAGIGAMNCGKFLTYNIGGWPGSAYSSGGYFFGAFPCKAELHARHPGNHSLRPAGPHRVHPLKKARHLTTR
jgi:membrane-associated protein